MNTETRPDSGKSITLNLRERVSSQISQRELTISKFCAILLDRRVRQKVHIGKDVIDMSRSNISRYNPSRTSAEKRAAYERRRQAEAQANEEKIARIIAEMEARKRALKAQQNTAG